MQSPHLRVGVDRAQDFLAVGRTFFDHTLELAAFAREEVDRAGLGYLALNQATIELYARTAAQGAVR